MKTQTEIEQEVAADSQTLANDINAALASNTRRHWLKDECFSKEAPPSEKERNMFPKGRWTP